MKKREFDFIIIGSGIAGLYVALLAQEIGRVLILTKGSIDECNTKYAQGGIAAPVGPGDSPQLHFEDTVAAGAGLCDPEMVRILVEEASDRIADLIKFGVPFDTVNGEVALTQEAAHSVPRILHAGGDATGERIETTLSRQARASRKITILEHCLAIEILFEAGRVQGVKAVDCYSGSVEEFHCRWLILATGGAGRLFKFTTNPEVATGDGIALAYRAGAEIMDMEFFQFHPTALRLPGVPVFLISEAVRGEGGVLRNVSGHRFMSEYSPQGDLAPRDVVARAILAEMKKTKSDHVLLDVTHLPARKIFTRFPHIYRFCLDHGLDITSSPIPVAPAAHYLMGGIRTDSWGRTNIPGLFACGEVACTGVHGANRLASNSLMETLVFSRRIVEHIREGAEGSKKAAGECFTLPTRDSSNLAPPPPSLTSLQELMWDNAGIVRYKEGLEKAALTLAAWEARLPKPTDRASWELANLILVGRLLVEAALIREESRGAHFRSDFPEPSPEWQKHIVFKKETN
ncbi:MAG: L-aspartate oxidase [Chloroflexi bacterium]|nr:MAG: L-aspartate oxidase [Chloroflexota bacterium]